MAPQTYGAFGGEEGAVREPREAESIRQFKANAARLMRWRANTVKLSWVLPALVLVVYGSGVGQAGLSTAGAAGGAAGSTDLRQARGFLPPRGEAGFLSAEEKQQEQSR